MLSTLLLAPVAKVPINPNFVLGFWVFVIISVGIGIMMVWSKKNEPDWDGEEDWRPEFNKKKKPKKLTRREKARRRKIERKRQKNLRKRGRKRQKIQEGQVRQSWEREATGNPRVIRQGVDVYGGTENPEWNEAITKVANSSNHGTGKTIMLDHNLFVTIGRWDEQQGKYVPSPPQSVRKYLRTLNHGMGGKNAFIHLGRAGASISTSAIKLFEEIYGKRR